MFTPDALLDIAIQAEADVKAAQASGGSVYPHYRRAQEAMVCAEWLDAQPVKVTPFVGSFGDVHYSRGDRVRIKHNSMIHSTNPTRRHRASKISYMVNVFFFFEGWVNTSARRDDELVRQPRVDWVGQGGYWCWTDAQNVETA